MKLVVILFVSNNFASLTMVILSTFAASDAPAGSSTQSKESPTLPIVPVASLPPSNVRQSAVTSANNTVSGRNYTARLETNHAANSLGRKFYEFFWPPPN